MNAADLKPLRYSADVRMHLTLGGHVLSIGQLGPDFIILREPTDHPPTDAEIAVSIDARERRWNVHLPDGISAAKPKTRITYSPSAFNGSTVG
jgi:hypothetical protein